MGLGLKDFLEQRCHVKERRTPYYLRWIAEFNVFCWENGRRDANGVASFIVDLAARFPRHHLAEAKHAVTLYMAFCGRAVSDTAGPSPLREIPEAWPSVKEELTRQLRLRAYRTEKTYRGELGEVPRLPRGEEVS